MYELVKEFCRKDEKGNHERLLPNPFPGIMTAMAHAGILYQHTCLVSARGFCSKYRRAIRAACWPIPLNLLDLL